MTSNVWNDCPICNCPLEFTMPDKSTAGFYKIFCSKSSHYRVYFGGYSPQNYLINIEVFEIDNLEICRDEEGVEIYDLDKRAILAVIDFQVPFKYLNSKSSIEKLLLLI